MRIVALAALTAGLAGCPQEEVSCGEFEEVFVWVDADGDGFGGPEADGYTCEPRDDQATNNVDCDDANASVNPSTPEACDVIDNDCDGVVDEALAFYPWFRDADGDGYGDPGDKQTFCMSPGDGWILVSGDCNDADPATNPEALETCDGGIDNDCDGQADDADGSLDLSTTTRWYVDGDDDGYGGNTYFDQCVSPNPEAVNVGGDCNDAQPSINPGVLEVCNPAVDENCNMLIDDADPYIDPASQIEFFADLDGDGFGDPNSTSLACVATPGIGVENSDDCDDNDAEAIDVDQNWYVDTDGDGVGAADAFAAFQCVRPTAGECAAPNTCEPESAGFDCAPDDPTIFPGAWDPCEDGLDSDCDTLDTCKSCKHWQDTLGAGLATDGVYPIEPSIGDNAQVWCDQTTDGGGWTLVLSSHNDPPNDAGTPHTVVDLQTLEPSLAHVAIWSGMRTVTRGGISDIRFACKLAGSSTMDVDLSFYDTTWYKTITNGTDAQSCFNEQEGNGADPPPARTDNVSGAYLPAGDQWDSGFLEGEDTCDDKQDFSVDFDDRGNAGNGNDGTDWGESNNTKKCVGNSMGEAWFIFVREN